MARNRLFVVALIAAALVAFFAFDLDRFLSFEVLKAARGDVVV